MTTSLVWLNIIQDKVYLRVLLVVVRVVDIILKSTYIYCINLGLKRLHFVWVSKSLISLYWVFLKVQSFKYIFCSSFSNWIIHNNTIVSKIPNNKINRFQFKIGFNLMTYQVRVFLEIKYVRQFTSIFNYNICPYLFNASKQLTIFFIDIMI